MDQYTNVTVGGIAKCTAKDNTRYAVNGAEVRAHKDGRGVFISATDGRVLAIIHDSEAGVTAGAEPSIIPGELLPTTKAGKANAVLSLNGVWKAAQPRKPDYQAIPNDGNFPPCKEILPELTENDGRVCINLNIQLLKNLADAIGEDMGHGPILTLWIGKPDKPVVCVGRPGTVGVAMPVNRSDGDISDCMERMGMQYTATRKAYVAACEA